MKFEIGDVVVMSEEGRKNFKQAYKNRHRRMRVVGYNKRDPKLVRLACDGSNHYTSWNEDFWEKA